MDTYYYHIIKSYTVGLVPEPCGYAGLLFYSLVSGQDEEHVQYVSVKYQQLHDGGYRMKELIPLHRYLMRQSHDSGMKAMKRNILKMVKWQSVFLSRACRVSA
jgi:hypothetical protein